MCSELVDDMTGEYKLVDIEGFPTDELFDESELTICAVSLLTTVIDLDIELIAEGRG